MMHTRRVDQAFIDDYNIHDSRLMTERAYAASQALVMMGTQSIPMSDDEAEEMSGTTYAVQESARTVDSLAAVNGTMDAGLTVGDGTGCTPITIAGSVPCNQNAVICGTVVQSQWALLVSLTKASDMCSCRVPHQHQLRAHHRQRLSGVQDAAIKNDVYTI
jgi:hypothetical protein